MKCCDCPCHHQRYGPVTPQPMTKAEWNERVAKIRALIEEEMGKKKGRRIKPATTRQRRGRP